MLHKKLWIVSGYFILTVAIGSTAVAMDKLSRGDKRGFEKEVSAIITAQEIETFSNISREDRKLFKELFWARRDPNPSTPNNEFRAIYEARVKQANQTFKQRRKKGSETDMGQIILLLGPPTERQRGDSRRSGGGNMINAGRSDGRNAGTAPRAGDDGGTSGGGGGGGANFDRNSGGRGGRSMVWMYDPMPPLGLPDGLNIEFRMRPQLGLRVVETQELRETLDRVKTRLIANPSINYARNKDGRLRELEDLYDPNSPAKLILQALRDTRTERTDIELQSHFSHFKSITGETYIPVLVETDARQLTWQKDQTNTTIFYVVEDVDGFPLYQNEETYSLTRVGDKAVLELPIDLAPGQYTVYMGIRDNVTEKVGTQISSLEVPRYSDDELKISSVLMFTEGKPIEDFVSRTGQAFLVGGYHWNPKLGKNYKQTDSILAVFHVYGYGLERNLDGISREEAPDITMQFAFNKDGKKLGQTTASPPQTVSVEMVIGVMQIPLASFEPGNYTVDMIIKDKVKDVSLTESIDFIINE